MIAPNHAVALKEDNPHWADLESGIWFRCNCGRIGHISELLFVNEQTQMWCPKCRQDEWRWANNGVASQTKN